MIAPAQQNIPGELQRRDDRLVWIHPFLDGNGRIARLMSHATVLDALDTGAVWSVARGLARNVAAYKAISPRATRPAARISTAAVIRTVKSNGGQMTTRLSQR